MLQADTGSRNRLIGIIAFLAALFGGFALWGTVSRAVERGVFKGGAIGEPVPVSADRAVQLAERREWYAVRKRMAERGRRGDYRGAVTIADEYLAKRDFGNISTLRDEALYRLGDKAGTARWQKRLQNDSMLNPHEADLLTGNLGAYRTATMDALRRADPAKLPTTDANNLAWRATFVPEVCDAPGVQKAVILAEAAVGTARKDNTASDDLPTYTNTLGAAYYRAGRYADAVRVLTESEKLRSDPFNAPFLAMAQARLGNKTVAKDWQNRFGTYLDTTYSTRDGQAMRHQLLLLWRETNAVVGQESGTSAVK